MKHLQSLSPDDLRTTPVWEVTLANGVEWAIPTSKVQISERESEIEGKVYIVRTAFRLNDLTEYVGFCSPQEPSGLDYVQPVIVTHSGHIPFYSDRTISSAQRETFLGQLGKLLEEVFPVYFRADVPCDGRHLTGTIDGFR